MKVKTLIAAAVAALTLAAAPAVQADAHDVDFAWMSNDAGGRIVLQAYACPWGNLWQGYRAAYSTTSGGWAITGCWMLDSSAPAVLMTWQDGSERTFAQNLFTLLGDTK